MEITATFRPNSTKTVDELKIEQGYAVDSKVFEITKNPKKDNKPFFQLGNLTGAVSQKVTPQEFAELYKTQPRMVCVSILDLSDGSSRLVLHKRHAENVLVTF